MNTCEDLIEQTGILPVINIAYQEAALPLSDALLSEKISVIEVTLRSDCSLDAIHIIKSQRPEMTVGAGTVLTTGQAKSAVDVGADFIVMPGFDEEIVDYCIDKNIPVFPGCVTPGEIQRGIKKGLKTFKFFPSELNGGVDALKLLSGPFPDIKFLPTGGITFDNLEGYLSKKFISAVGGSFMATASQLKNGDFDGIRMSCKKAVKISLGFKLAHVGINSGNSKTALNEAKKLSDIFGFDMYDAGKSVFSEKYAEFMKTAYYGEKGHIGFYTNSVKRALAYFEKNNIEIIKESMGFDSKGEPEFVYLKETVGGFAIHIVQK